MPFEIVDHSEIRRAVYEGKADPKELPSNKVRAEARAKEEAEWRKVGHTDPVFRDDPDNPGQQLALPQWVQDREKETGRQMVFMRTVDRQGFPWSGFVDSPPEKPESVKQNERRLGIPYRFDPITGAYHPSPRPPMPPVFQRVADLIGDPSDPRFPVWNERLQTYQFPTAAPTPQHSSRVIDNPVTGRPWVNLHDEGEPA